MLLSWIGVPRSNGCGGKMKRDEGSVIKEQGSAEGGLVCLLPPTYPPSAPHVFSFSHWNSWLWLPARRFLATNMDFVSAEFGGCHSVPGRAPIWPLLWLSPQLVKWHWLTKYLSNTQPKSLYITVEVLPFLFCPWQWGGVGVGVEVAGSQNTPCLPKTHLTRLTKGRSYLHLKKLVLISLLWDKE